MITLPTTPRNRPVFRVLTMPEGTWNSQTWTALPIPSVFGRDTLSRLPWTVERGGIHIGSIARWCLPDEDRAEFYIDTGDFDDGYRITAPDLSGKVIRIQVYDDENAPNGDGFSPTTNWKTVFLGSLVEARHVENPGRLGSGRTTYYCAGPSMRLRLWPMDRHSCGSVVHAKGHPGYNVPLHGLFRQVIGNLDGGGGTVNPTDLAGSVMADYYTKHSLPVSRSSASKWSDKAAVKHGLASSRSYGDMFIRVDLDNGLFDGYHSWSINPGDSAWDFLRRVCNRQRGRGTVYFDYEDSDYDDGDVSIILKTRAPFSEVVLYRQVKSEGDLDMSSVEEIAAAEYGVDAVDVDINGDHRVVGPFTYTDRYNSLVDHLVVQGEKIQVCCNLNFFGSTLAKRWSSQDEVDFKNISVINQRLSPRWRHVWRRYGLQDTDALNVKAEPAATNKNIDYAMYPNGEIYANSGLTSRMSFRILGDVPIYEGWRYDRTTPARWDGSEDYLPPVRMSPVIAIRGDKDKDTSPTWLPLHYAGFNIQVDDYGLYIAHQLEEKTGARLLADKTSAPYAYQDPKIPGVNGSSGISLSKLNTIVGVELGTHVSFSTEGPYTGAGKRLIMNVNGVHLWLGAPGAVWELDYLRAAQENYTPGLKFPASKAAYIIRDDRNALSFIFALASKYYTEIRNPGQWTLADCGFLTGFATLDSGTVKYPTLGQLVGRVTYKGEKDAETSTQLNTPITSIFYEHERGITTWRTDYVSYDGGIQ